MNVGNFLSYGLGLVIGVAFAFITFKVAITSVRAALRSLEASERTTQTIMVFITMLLWVGFVTLGAVQLQSAVPALRDFISLLMPTLTLIVRILDLLKFPILTLIALLVAERIVSAVKVTPQR